MTTTLSLLTEFTMEASTTRRMLERIPQQSLGWRPHDKSGTLGELATHLANIPGIFIASINQDGFDRSTYKHGDTTSVNSILATHDRNVAEGQSTLKKLHDAELMKQWRYTVGDSVVFELPRIAVIRGMGINHMIHHRGQLSVYLRLLNIPLPNVYGPTADG